MKCPYCSEELGINNVCINMTCSHFSTTINFSENSKLNKPNESSLKSQNYNVKKNSYNKFDYNLNANYNELNNDNSNNSYYNIKNESADKSFNFHNNNISKEEFAAFIGANNTNYYLKYAHKLENNKKFLSWNWPCFFLNSYWLLYRKLYIPGFILAILAFISSKIFEFKTHLFLILIVRIILAIIANSVYLNNCTRKIQRIKETISGLNKSQYINKLHAKGGVNLVLPLTLLSIYIFIIIVNTTILFLDMANHPDFNHLPSYYF